MYRCCFLRNNNSLLGKTSSCVKQWKLVCGEKNKNIFFSSEEYPLKVIKAKKLKVLNDFLIIDIPVSNKKIREKYLLLKGLI